jgi:hypothetical protein
MGNEIELSVVVRADRDGFLSRQCPVCQKRFRVKPGEGSKLPLGFCPYCGHEGRGCWFTPAQSKYFRAAAQIAMKKTVFGPFAQQLPDIWNSFMLPTPKETFSNCRNGRIDGPIMMGSIWRRPTGVLEPP